MHGTVDARRSSVRRLGRVAEHRERVCEAGSAGRADLAICFQSDMTDAALEALPVPSALLGMVARRLVEDPADEDLACDPPRTAAAGVDRCRSNAVWEGYRACLASRLVMATVGFANSGSPPANGRADGRRCMCQHHVAGDMQPAVFVDYDGHHAGGHRPGDGRGPQGDTRLSSPAAGHCGASNLTYAEATWSQGLSGLGRRTLSGLRHGSAGWPAQVVVGQSEVRRDQGLLRYEARGEPAPRHGRALRAPPVVPARPRKPRDRAKDRGGGPRSAERWIVGVGKTWLAAASGSCSLTSETSPRCGSAASSIA